MSFTVAYNITAIDKFSAVSDKIRKSIVGMEQAAKSANMTQEKSIKIASQYAARRDSIVKSTKASSAATKRSTIEEKALTAQEIRHKEVIRDIDQRIKQRKDSTHALNMKIREHALATSIANRKIKESNKIIREAKKREREYQKALADRQRALRKSAAMMRDVGSKLSGFGNFLHTRVTLPVLGMGTAAWVSANKFNKSMASVGTLIPGQTEKLKAYKKEVLDMSVRFGQSSDVISSGLYQVISSVGDTTNTMRTLEIANRAAVAGNADAAASVNLLTGVSSDYGDTSEQMMQKISDLSFKAVELGVTTFPELAQEMGRTTTQARTLGVSVEELFGSYAGLTSGTVRTNMVSTRLAGVMNALTKSTGPLGKALKEMDVKSGKDLIARFGGLQNALMALRHHVGGNEIAFSKLFEDQEARLAALAMTGAKAKELSTEIIAMGKAAGATQTAFEEQTNGIGKSAFQAEQTRQKFMKLTVEWGDKLMPIADKLMDRVDGLIDFLSGLDDETIETAMNVGIWAAKIGLASKAVGGLLSFTGGMRTFFLDYGKGASSAATTTAELGTVTGALTGEVKGLSGALKVAGPLMASLIGGLAIGNEIWKFIESKQKAELEHENKRATVVRRAKDMSLKEAETKLQKMKESWAIREKEARVLAAASGQKYAGTSLLGGGYSANRSLRIDQENARALQRRVNALTKVNNDVSADYFYGQSPLSDASRSNEKTVLEMRVRQAPGMEVEVEPVKKGGFSKVDTGSNY